MFNLSSSSPRGGCSPELHELHYHGTFRFHEKLRNLAFNSTTPPDAANKQIPFSKCAHGLGDVDTYFFLKKYFDLRSECVL